MKGNLSQVKSELEKYAEDANLTELEVVRKLQTYYFNKKVNQNIKLYRKGKKKVSEVLKDLQISPRRFYAILDKKKVPYTKYNKGNS